MTSGQVTYTTMLLCLLYKKGTVVELTTQRLNKLTSVNYIELSLAHNKHRVFTTVVIIHLSNIF